MQSMMIFPIDLPVSKVIKIRNQMTIMGLCRLLITITDCHSITVIDIHSITNIDLHL